MQAPRDPFAAPRAGGNAPPAPTPAPALPVWDPLIRLTHWLVAAAVLANWLVTKPGAALHVGIGWAVLALLAVRAVWGLVGPAAARFSAFPPQPLAALGHLLGLARKQKPRDYPSHNPAGAMMVYALWGLLLVVGLTGLVMTGARSPMTIAAQQAAVTAGDWSALVPTAPTGDDAEEDGDGGDGLMGEVHELAANLLLLLAALHVAGVVVESRALRRNLVRPMIWPRGPQA